MPCEYSEVGEKDHTDFPFGVKVPVSQIVENAGDLEWFDISPDANGFWCWGMSTNYRVWEYRFTDERTALMFKLRFG